jgi:hypothetical protein
MAGPAATPSAKCQYCEHWPMGGRPCWALAAWSMVTPWWAALRHACERHRDAVDADVEGVACGGTGGGVAGEFERLKAGAGGKLMQLYGAFLPTAGETDGAATQPYSVLPCQIRQALCSPGGSMRSRIFVTSGLLALGIAGGTLAVDTTRSPATALGLRVGSAIRAGKSRSGGGARLGRADAHRGAGHPSSPADRGGTGLRGLRAAAIRRQPHGGRPVGQAWSGNGYRASRHDGTPGRHAADGTLHAARYFITGGLSWERSSTPPRPSVQS